jgi:hypothetical protein
MSKEAFRLELRARLKELGEQIAAAEARHDAGAYAARVDAAGELLLLNRRKAEILAKIERLEHEPDGPWETLKTEIEEDLDAINVALRRLVVGR